MNRNPIFLSVSFIAVERAGGICREMAEPAEPSAEETSAALAATEAMENFGGDSESDPMQEEEKDEAVQNEVAAAEETTSIEPTSQESQEKLNAPAPPPLPVETDLIEQEEEVVLPPPSNEPVEGELTEESGESSHVAEEQVDDENRVPPLQTPTPPPNVEENVGREPADLEPGGTSTDGYVETPREYRIAAAEAAAAEAAAAEAAANQPIMKIPPVEPPQPTPPLTEPTEATTKTSPPVPNYFPADEVVVAEEEEVVETIPLVHSPSSKPNYFPADEVVVAEEGKKEEEELAEAEAAAAEAEAAAAEAEAEADYASAALKIQNAHRTKEAKKKVQAKRDQRNQSRAAVGIQNAARRRAAKRRVQQIREQKQSEIEMIEKVEKVVEDGEKRAQVLSSRNRAGSGGLESDEDDVDSNAPALQELEGEEEIISSLLEEEEENAATTTTATTATIAYAGQRLPTPQLVAEEGETSVLALDKYDTSNAEDLDYALDLLTSKEQLLHEKEDAEEDEYGIETPVVTPDDGAMGSGEVDDFGFDQLEEVRDEETLEMRVTGSMEASMHGRSPPPRMPRGMRTKVDIMSPARWQNGASVLIQSWYRGAYFRRKNYALLVACRRLYERSNFQNQLEQMHLEDLATHREFLFCFLFCFFCSLLLFNYTRTTPDDLT